MGAYLGFKVKTNDGLKPSWGHKRRKKRRPGRLYALERQGRNKERDGVGGGDPEPAQESEAGILGTSRKEGAKAFHQPLCNPRTGLEKTKRTCLGVKVQAKVSV